MKALHLTAMLLVPLKVWAIGTLSSHRIIVEPKSEGRNIEVESGSWTHLGCFSELPDRRLLPAGMSSGTNNTIENCTRSCFDSGYQFAGVEYASECYCGKTLENATEVISTDCNMRCPGNDAESCGGPNRLNLFNYTGSDLPRNSEQEASAHEAVPIIHGIDETWKYAGCYIDNAHGRIMEVSVGSDPQMTAEKCVTLCEHANAMIAGIEYGSECYCGGRLINGASEAEDSSCSMSCSGASSQSCGGPNRMSVYSSRPKVVSLPVPVAQTSDLPGAWNYLGCYSDNESRVLPWKIVWKDNNTVSSCLEQCASFGYTAAGLEFGEECYCGDGFDIPERGGQKVADTDCSRLCSGDPAHLCGGEMRLQMYTLNETVNVWHRPSTSGRYEFFVPGVVVPLVATVGINNKVSFLEKAGTGPGNSTGAYELDLSLAHDPSRAWREMHVKTDVFCSGSIVLPDIAGRQLNVGGWSEDSLSGVRLYAPDGAPGQNSINDWEEDVRVVSLQRARWYPTAAMLPNGSVLVIGGEVGANAAAQPNLEILPQPEGGSVVELDWLNRTDPNNLYPYVFVLPSGRLFVAYHNEARILDGTTFETVKTLPNIPGAVNNFEGGRSYPLEGAAMTFPQRAPYTDLLRVLICGGSTSAALIALDNCVSIEPEASNPTWTIERMPSKRVMPCMTALPDGTFLILNGAEQGVAGFNLASQPNLQALLYDPRLPVRERISILNRTSIPRLYHSESTLLPDASVLVSGSDPQTVAFDQEYRIEVYYPPYLSRGFKQPSYHLTENDWEYGKEYVIAAIELFQGRFEDITVSLIAASSSTHGNTMGSRTLFPAFSCRSDLGSCKVVAPPNSFISPPGWHQLFLLDGPTPSHSSWVRIGGDPAQLGDWPNHPGFKPPGMTKKASDRYFYEENRTVTEW